MRPGPPRRVTLGLAELVLAARLAGDVPLPLTPAVEVADRDRLADRLADRLGAPPLADARGLVRRELAGVDDAGPGGARAGLAGRGLLGGDGILAPGLVTALQVLAGGALSVVLDVGVVRPGGGARLRAWFGVGPGLAVQLTTVGPLALELVWFDPRLWVPQLTRAVRAEPRVPGRASLVVPDHVTLPTELLAGALKAHRDRRPDLLAALAVAHDGRVRLGERREVRAAGQEEVLALLETLGASCRGRLRLLTTRRDHPPRRRVAAWLLLDGGWHELRPGPGATSLLRRRDARDLGLFTWPLVAEVA